MPGTQRFERLTPRQVIVGVHQSASEWATAFERPLALDLFGSLVAVDGVTLAIAVESERAARAIAAEIPAGIELHVGSDDERGSGLFDIVDLMANRGFARMLFFATDTLGVTTRLARTALSALAFDDLVVGLTSGTGLYAFGLTDTRADSGNQLSAVCDALVANQAPSGLTNRFERLARLRELGGIAELHASVDGREKTLPRTTAALRESSAA